MNQTKRMRFVFFVLHLSLRMIIAVNFPSFQLLLRRRASTGFEPVTSTIPVRCSTNWAMKPHIGSEVNLWSSYLPWGVKWCEVNVKPEKIRDFWDFFRLLSNCLNWKIKCDDHSSLSSTTAVQIWIISLYIITKSMHTLWLANQLWVIVSINPRKNRASSELLFKSNRPQVSMGYLSDRLQVSMGYKLINHLGCW